MSVNSIVKLFSAVFLLIAISSGSALATVYSDAETGTDGWVIFDATPSGATISAVRDDRLNSQVIETSGEGRLNGYLLGGTSNSSGWRNTDEPVLEWNMSTAEPFAVMVYVETEMGSRRIFYNNSNSDSLRNPSNNTIHFGLGSSSIDGAWQTHRRNIADEVATGEPGNRLLCVEGIVILGSMRLDNVSLLTAVSPPSTTPPPTAEDTPPVVVEPPPTVEDSTPVVVETPTGSTGETVYSTAESGVDGWTVFDNTPAGASVTAIFDTALGGQVIQTNGAGRNNSYLLGGINADSGWNNRSEFVFSWDMSTNESFGVQVYVDTQLGVRRLVYSQSNSDGGSNPNNNSIGFGLGSATVGGGWINHQKNLATDLSNSEPGNLLLSVNGIVVLGSLRIDNVSLSVGGNEPPDDTSTIPVTVPTDDTPDDTPPPPSGIDPGSAAAARLLAQATFGPKLSDIARVRRLGVTAWVDEQFTLEGGSHLDYAISHPGSGSLTGPRQHMWLIDAIDGSDQLRQRVAFALSQILVISDVSQNLRREQYAIANYYDLLRQQAFGNYRELLESVTLSPMMGLYLSMLQNARGDASTNTRADENFAREIMQLFTIGLHELNIDGSVRLGADGLPIPAYTQADVEEYARVYTGWSYAGTDRFNHLPGDGNTDKFLPMEPFPGFHDTGAKNLLRGGVSTAGISAEQDLANALDSLFNHPNMGPFLGKQLIQRLVTSNPTPGYIRRVASVFNNNGNGVRGDLQAVVRAILLDTEARSGYASIAHYGKLREPLIRWTHVWRSFNVQRGLASQNNQYNHGSPYIYNGMSFLGQSVLSSLSVFNFYHPDYSPLVPLRTSNLLVPEAEIYSDANILTTTARLSGFSQRFYQGADPNSLNSSYLDISEETELAATPSALIDRLDLLLLSGQMSAGMRGILLNHFNALPSDEAGRSQRVRDGITLVMASPEYLVQK